MRLFRWFRRDSPLDRYKRAKEDLESYEQAIRNINSFSDKQLDKYHHLIKKVRKLKKLSYQETGNIVQIEQNEKWNKV